MDEKRLTTAGNRIFIIFLAVPIFIIVWVLTNYFYAFIVGLGSAALLYVLFVLLPEGQMEREMRKAKFGKASKLLKKTRKKIEAIKNTDLKKDLDEACELGFGLISALEKEPRHQGKVEESLVPILENMDKQVDRWLLHQNNEQPLAWDKADKLLGVLFNYDTLFLKYQEGAIRPDEFLTSLYHSETAMLELGIDINDIK